MKKEFVFRLVLALGIFLLVWQFGVKPLLGGPTVTKHDVTADWLKSFSPAAGNDYDVVVMGAEPEGITAAVSAARLGARTLLLSEGADLGGTVTSSMLQDIEIPYGQSNNVLNGGIASEINFALGKQFSGDKYLTTVDKLVKSEMNIDVKYNVSLKSVSESNSVLKSLAFASDGTNAGVNGRFFIDATRDGVLLSKCRVPYSTGSQDLNLQDSYMPVVLNFEMEGPDDSKIRELYKDSSRIFYSALAGYIPIDINTRIFNAKIFFPESGRIMIQGLETANLDVSDDARVRQVYAAASGEAQNLAYYLANKLEALKGWKYLKAADSFYIREKRHFAGLYSLTVSDILENRYFDDTVAMGSYPVQTGKFAGGGTYFAGKPVQYGIPLDSLIPVDTKNILMVGAKASYSSLASSSAGALGTGMAEGEAAGVAAVYCLAKGTTPSDIATEKDRKMSDDIRDLLAQRGFYLPKTAIDNKNASNWSYPAARQLLSLGLVAGGQKNNLCFDIPAKKKDLAVILLNGIYRLDKDKYTLDLDAGIRPYFKDEGPLTPETAGQVLLSLYGLKDSGDGAYASACEQGYIDGIMELRLKNKKVLTMDDVYYLGDYNIKLYTQKDIKD